MCGSCPFLYGELRGISYNLGNVLVNITDEAQISKTVLYQKYESLWICEKEEEITYLLDEGQFKNSNLQKNNEYYVLTFGDRLEFKNSLDQVLLKGFYKVL